MKKPIKQQSKPNPAIARLADCEREDRAARVDLRDAESTYLDLREREDPAGREALANRMARLRVRQKQAARNLRDAREAAAREARL